MTRTASCPSNGDLPSEHTATDVAVPEKAGGLFRRSRSSRSRNTLIERYMPLVRAISVRLAPALPGSVDIEDLVSVGIFGLMDAIRRYDPRYGAQFQTYCALRIRGAMLDEVRHQRRTPSARGIGFSSDPPGAEAPDAARKRASGGRAESGSAYSALGQQTVRMNVSLTEDRHVGGEQAVRSADIVEDHGPCDPVLLLQEKERRDLLTREIRRLPKPERLLVMLYYFDELTMKQVGEILNVTESRVCQMHSGILIRLQQRLSELDEARPGRP